MTISVRPIQVVRNINAIGLLAVCGCIAGPEPAIDPGDDAIEPGLAAAEDAAPDDPAELDRTRRPRFEILHVRFTLDGPELVAGSLDGQILPLRSLEGGVSGAGRNEVSPDGTRVAFASFDSAAGQWALFVRRLPPRASREVFIAHTGGDVEPTWSPDGRSLAYAVLGPSTSSLFVASPRTGEPRLLATVPTSGFAPPACMAPHWSPDGDEIALSTRTGLATVRVSDGQIRHLLPLGSAISNCEPQWSPDGAAIAFAQTTASGGQVVKIARSGGSPIPLAPTNGGITPGQARWSPDGRLLAYVTFESGAVLRIVGADGGASRLLDRLDASVAAGHPTFSPDGADVLYTRFHNGPILATIPVTGGERRELPLSAASIDGAHATWLRRPVRPGSSDRDP